MKTRCWLSKSVLIVTVLVLSGCGQHVLWSPKGTMQQQQRRAAVFDPYSDNEAGPSLTGVRPRDFQKPLAEPVRMRQVRDAWWFRQQSGN